MKKILIFLAFVLFLGIAFAQDFNNGSFEEGNLSGWDTNIVGICEPSGSPIASISGDYRLDGQYSLQVYQGGNFTYCLSPQKTYNAGTKVCYAITTDRQGSYGVSNNLYFYDDENFIFGSYAWSDDKEMSILCATTRISGKVILKFLKQSSSPSTAYHWIDDFRSENYEITDTISAPNSALKDQSFTIGIKTTDIEGILQNGAGDTFPNYSFETGDFTNWTKTTSGANGTIVSYWASDGNKSMEASNIDNTADYVKIRTNSNTAIERGDKVCFDYNSDNLYSGIGYSVEITSGSGVNTNPDANYWCLQNIYDASEVELKITCSGTFYCSYASGKKIKIDNIKIHKGFWFSKNLITTPTTKTLYFDCDVNGENCSATYGLDFNSDTNYFNYTHSRGVEQTYYYYILFQNQAVNNPTGKPAYYYTKTAVRSLTVAGAIGIQLKNTHIITDENTNISIQAKLFAPEEITNATCSTRIGSGSWNSMTYTGGYYTYARSPLTEGLYLYDVNCSYGGTIYTKQGDIRVYQKLFLDLEIIENIQSLTQEFDAENNQVILTIIPEDESKDIKLKIGNSGQNSINAKIKIQNSLKDGKQYFIYYANSFTDYNAGNWTLDTSLSYGSGFSDPIQKIWKTTYYEYSYEETFFSGSSKYYKLGYKKPMYVWNRLKGNSDWLKLYEPAETDLNNLTWDTYTVYGAGNYYSNIRNQLIEEIPQLSDTDYAYEFQFTAFASIPTYIYVGENTIDSVLISTEPHRYSISIDDETLLKFFTSVSTTRTITMVDFVLIQRGFFKTKIKLQKENYELLDVWTSDENFEGLDVNYILNGSETTQIFNKNFSIGQTFTIGAISTTIYRVDLKANAYGDVNFFYWTAKIYDSPAKTKLLGTNKSIIVEDSASSIPLYWEFVFSPISVQPSTQYYVEFTKLSADDTNYDVYYDNNGNYVGGMAYFNGVAQSGYDLMFKTYSSGGAFFYNFIEEGQAFRSGATIYDRDGILRQMRVEVFADAEIEENKIMQYTKDITTVAEQDRLLDELISGIVLISETGGEITPVKVSIALCDNQNRCYESASAWVYLHNYPFFASDKIIQTFENARQPNTAPYGKIILRGRVPENFTDIEMFIFKGAWICPSWRLGQNGCTANKTASESDLKFTHSFYKNKDFICTPNGICDFAYNLENYYHYAESGEYTTFSVIHYNTEDSNSHYSRTIYTIQKLPLLVYGEYQGLDANYYSDFNCYGNLAGVVRTGETAQSYLQKILDLPVVSKIVDWGATTYSGITRWVDDWFGTDFTPDASSPITQLLYGNYSCVIRIPNHLNLKIVAHTYTQKMEDITDYIGGSYFRIRRNDTKEIISPALYPVDYFYDLAKGSNELVWNTILYDSNGGYLDDGHYEIVFYIKDESKQNENNSDTVLDLIIDNSIQVQAPQDIEFIPADFYAVSGNILTLRSYLATRQKYVDELEFVLFTDNSSFKVGKSDKENQIIKFSLDAEDLYKISDKLDFNLGKEFSTFRQDYANADILGGCISGGLVGAGTLFLTGVALDLTGVGLPIGMTLKTLAIAGALGGCGTGSTVNYATTTSYNLGIDNAKIKAMEEFSYNQYKPITIQVKNPAINDYSELVKLLGTDENATSPKTIINDLAKKGKSSPLADIEVIIAGKKYVFKNVLVGEGEFYEDLKKGNVKLRINAYYDYHTKVKVKILDLITLQKQGTDVESQLVLARDSAIDFIKKYSLLIIIGVFGIIAVAYVRVVIFGRPRE